MIIRLYFELWMANSHDQLRYKVVHVHSSGTSPITNAKKVPWPDEGKVARAG